MKIRWKPLLLCLAVPVALGSLVGFFTMDGMKRFPMLEQPPLSPPTWLFPVVWTVLYLMMGLASYLVRTGGASEQEREEALHLYRWQLAVNLAWPVLFFGLGWYWLAFGWLVLLLVLILWTMLKFYKVDGRTVFLLLPYLLWVGFAGYLNCGIALLN